MDTANHSFRRARRAAGLILLASLVTGARAADYFGSSERQEAALIGILYDLKQDQERRPKNAGFQELLGRFVREGWEESILNAYYRATRPLYTTQIFVPLIGADTAPRAFGVEDIIRPRQWVIHYKGQVRPPQAGTYRFVGLSDDLLAVAVNGKTVMIGEHGGSRLKNHGWRDAPRDQIRTGSGLAVAGDWFTVQNGEVIDLDVVIGERPGGQFAAWLMIQQQGVTYGKDADGKDILPVFQLAPAEVPGRESCARPARPEELWSGVP